MEKPLSVSEFNQRISSLITYSDTVRNIEMVGEISELKTASSGHIYLSLKDSSSSVKCTLFKFAASRLKFAPKVGMKVSVFGSASYYTPSGSLSFNIEGMSPYGEGELKKALEELKLKLMNEGLFENDRKRQLPRYPKVIGVVTSATGSVIVDILNTTALRYPADILLAPATVQGEGAPESIIRGITLLNEQNVDVIIIGRGGGSADDLSAFNNEGVARAVATSKAPVISAVGHGTDKSITDLVADKYADTPTAAAMLATPDKAEEKKYIRSLWQRLDIALGESLGRIQYRFESLDARLSPKNAKNTLDIYRSRFENMCSRSDMAAERIVTSYRNRFQMCDSKLDPRRLAERVNHSCITLDSLSDRLINVSKHMNDERRMRLESLSSSLEGLDPNKVLDRGYCFISDGHGNVIQSAGDMFVGTDITIQMKDGTAVAKVKELKLNG